MSKHASTSRWLMLCILGIAMSFLANLIYSRKISAEIDGYVESITRKSGASVIHLFTITEDIRLISTRALQARPETRADDRARISTWEAEMDAAISAYGQITDSPEEDVLFRRAEQRRAPFLSAVDHAFAATGDGAALPATALTQVAAAADDFATQVRALKDLNAAQLSSEGEAVIHVRHRARTIYSALRSLIVALAMLGILLSWIASRQHVALAENNQRLAEERAHELEMFAGRVAHDLRNPLAVLEMKTATAARHDMVPALRTLLEAVRKQGRRMNEIIDALLTFALAGASPESDLCANIEEVVREVMADHQSMVSETGIEFVIDPVPADVGAACSPRVLGIVLGNLIGNATKYIDGGRQSIRRITFRLEDLKERLRFEVRDTGPGLPTGKEGLVFQPFIRFSRNSTGVGLGLATVKRLVEAHRGRVGVESSPGLGCRFWFELPKAEGAPPVQSIEPPAQKAAAGEG